MANDPETVGVFPPAGTVLVVDDDAGFLSETRLALVGAGYVVGQVDSTFGVLSELSRTQYDLVLLEVSMRDTSGIDVLRSIREAELFTAVILLDREPDACSERAGTELGALSYVRKPLGLPRLLQLVHEGVRSAKLARVKTLGA